MGWKPIKDMSDDEVMEELMERMKKAQNNDIQTMLDYGTGPRQLLNLERNMERNKEKYDHLRED